MCVKGSFLEETVSDFFVHALKYLHKKGVEKLVKTKAIEAKRKLFNTNKKSLINQP